MLLGFVWAVAAPLLLLIPVALLTRLLRQRRPAWTPRRRRVVAVGATLAVVLLAWLPGRLRFATLCDELGLPRIEARAAVAGFLLDDSTAHSFGMRYLLEEGFDWIEARSIVRPGGTTRYRKAGDRIEQDEIDQPTAAHVLQSTHESHPGGVSISRQVIRERAGGRVLAQAASARFDGGPAKWVLGAWGSASCPDPVTAEGNRRFQASYHLARDTLGRPR